ncbi:conserved hypothetical protein [Desulforamulus reducens MI-1]|uniref:VTT domain-containing protein n=1 Tax=Desulforamulus reducens (strain ATCC BAA-1160 / DSM 100696 / MI-1) TaxID=349161 RepID=A4J6V7_DESRM|nr:YqaA family protein [Desulforamulus reducens]ABO50810.1 conserved hypothetical protein [Desulforamulus reducens MI-1]
MELLLDFFAEYGSIGLALLSFIESSFFPIPPDILLIGMAIAQPEQGLWFATVTAVASIIGGLFGYLIGMYAGRPLLERWVSLDRLGKIQNLFDRYGGWAVAIAGFTPIPYKLFTISAGVFRINKVTFMIASALSRGARFYLEVLLIIAVGEKAKALLEGYFEVITVGICFVIVALIWLVKKFTTKAP